MMSKWVKVLVAAFITSCLFLILVIPFIYGKPIGFLKFGALLVSFLIALWWLIFVIRKKEDKVHFEEPQEVEVVPPKETLFIFLGVLGIIPWAFIWILFLAPIFGLAHLPVKGQLIFVLGIYAAAWVFLTRRK